MIKKLTGKSAFPHYTMYGCYCGLGGHGQPRDATDSCCFAHDCCYEKLRKCRTKTDRYRFSITDGVVTCGGGTWCEQQICACDKAAAACLRGSLSSYNAKYRFYSDKLCAEPSRKC
ncbi:phospholipase A2 crotoxin basic chain CBa2-like isoform X2 [Varanus komodoensis]|nr:phospholipase A2 crotoxin basic chain CBa2-like isoform X2 [Varanus komodoensis]